MADESTGAKTEEPTPKRKREAREKGQVAKSQELNQAFTLLASFMVLYFSFSTIIQSLRHEVTKHLTFSTVNEMTKSYAFSLIADSAFFTVGIVAPVMLAAAIIGIVINFSQVGPLMTVESIKPKLSNIDIIKGFKKIFSLKSFVEMIKAVLKIIIISTIAYVYIKGALPKLNTMTQQGLNPALAFLGNLIFKTAVTIILFIVVVGIFDFIYQRWEHKKSLKMSKYEVKQERKQMEGDPLIKQKRKERQRSMSMNRMMTAMEDANVVIANPTHIAVALKFDMETMDAPVVVAKGEGFVALKIKEKAYKLDIEVVENKPLARSLNKMCDIGDVIPEELYEAAAEVLAYVYEQENKF